MSQDSVTQVADDLTESFITLEKEITDRRTGVVRRSEDSDSARNFRREVEREYRAELRQLRDENHGKDIEISALKAEIAGIREWMKGNDETLTAAKMIVSAGLVFRYVIIGIVGITAAIGGMAAAMETLRAWFVK
jgi:hypothetical protein